MIHPTGATARRFPLVARPRPTCTPLQVRVDSLSTLAATAIRTSDKATATAVFNLSALLASDCGLPDIARSWSRRLAYLALNHQHDPQHALEPIVNLARLRTRAGDGLGAWSMLETLYQAIVSRTDAVIDGIEIPAERLTADTEAHQQLRGWLWAVLLSSGAHALTVAGQWDEARFHLGRYKGIGWRMLDGRQIEVIAHSAGGREDQALSTLGATRAGEPWENAVTTCLTLLCTDGTSASAAHAAIATRAALNLSDRGLTVFWVRLGLSVLDALPADHPDVQRLIVSLLRQAAHDGYAARDVLAHPACRNLRPEDADRLADLVKKCGLDSAEIPGHLMAQLVKALDTVAAEIDGYP